MTVVLVHGNPETDAIWDPLSRFSAGMTWFGSARGPSRQRLPTTPCGADRNNAAMAVGSGCIAEWQVQCVSVGKDKLSPADDGPAELQPPRDGTRVYTLHGDRLTPL